MTITSFPWDVHTCDINLSSWVLTEDDITIEINHNWTSTTSMFLPNSEWDVKRYPVTMENLLFENYGNFSYMTYRLRFKRRTGFFTYVIILPSVLMSFMTVIVFLPAC